MRQDVAAIPLMSISEGLWGRGPGQRNSKKLAKVETRIGNGNERFNVHPNPHTDSVSPSFPPSLTQFLQLTIACVSARFCCVWYGSNKQAQTESRYNRRFKDLSALQTTQVK